MLFTKFFLPENRAGSVARPRLFSRLDQAEGCSLFIAAAPAGFGKTTLVSAWVRARQIPAAWVSLDESDNDPTRFWACLLTALDQIFPEIDRNSRALLVGGQPLSSRAMLTTLLNDLALQPPPAPGA